MAAAIGSVIAALAHGASSVTSGSITTTTGDTLFVSEGGDPGVTFNTPTDNKSNTFSLFGGSTLATGSNRLGNWTKENAAGGSGHTVTATFSGNTDNTVFFGNITGVGATSLDSASARNTDGSSPFTATTGTLAQAGNLALAFITSNTNANPSTYAESTGFASLIAETDAVTNWGGAVFTKTTAATTALTPSITLTAGSATEALVACLVFKSSAGGAAYTLDIAPAAYALTTSAETLTATRALSVAPVSYAVTAAPVTLSVGRALAVSPASYALSAAAVSLTATRALNIAPASYVLSAAAVTLTYALAVKELIVDPASYTLTASNETLTVDRALNISPASYSLTASAQTLSVGRVLSVSPASYALTTSAETLTTARALSIDPASYSITAAPVTLDYGTANKVLIVDPASYVLSLPDVALEYRAVGVDAPQSYPGSAKKKKKAKNYVYDFSPAEQKPEPVEPAKVVAVTSKPAAPSTAAIADTMRRLEASQTLTAEVMAEQTAIAVALKAALAEQDDEDETIATLIAMLM